MIVKVKEPIAVEWPRMRAGQVIYTYFHFAASEELTRAGDCLEGDRGRVRDGRVVESRAPAPHADVRSRGPHGVQEGAKYLERVHGGRGVLLGGVPGVAPAEVVILGWWRRSASMPPRSPRAWVPT
jgi:alanine dehydrogenase